jgi:NAD(P)-dependent dehydrogenase (short-subunit alcohol dehydrogenase family)
MTRPVCAIVGVGPGNGAAFARKFAEEGYRVAMLSRNVAYLRELEGAIPNARGYRYDATAVDRAAEVFGQIKQELGPISVLIYNAGGGHFKTMDQAGFTDLEDDWRVNTLGCLAAVKRVLPEMRGTGDGTIVIIGATASLRGGPGSAPFASAKAAQRSLAQSMARHLWPQKVHVCYVIIDGVIDLPRTRRAMPDRPDDFFLSPDGIAQSVFQLTRQPQSAWSFEIDLRPYGERW